MIDYLNNILARRTAMGRIRRPARSFDLQSNTEQQNACDLGGLSVAHDGDRGRLGVNPRAASALLDCQVRRGISVGQWAAFRVEQRARRVYNKPEVEFHNVCPGWNSGTVWPNPFLPKEDISKCHRYNKWQGQTRIRRFWSRFVWWRRDCEKCTFCLKAADRARLRIKPWAVFPTKCVTFSKIESLSSSAALVA